MNRRLQVTPFFILLFFSYLILAFSIHFDFAYAISITDPSEYTMTEIAEGQILSKGDFITINSAEEFNAFSNYVNQPSNSTNVKKGTFKLTTDIELNEDPSNYIDWEYDPPTNAWIPIGTESAPFSGYFDGGGFVISGVFIDSTEDHQGLFGYNTGYIMDVGIENFLVKGKSRVGGLVGYNDGDILDCFVGEGIVCSESHEDGDSLGGIIGTNDSEGLLFNSYNWSTVRGSGYTGHYSLGCIVGSNYGTMGNCYNAGNSAGGADYKGSVVGYFDDSQGGVVSNCYWLVGTGGFNLQGTLDRFDEDGILSTANNDGRYGVNITINETSLRDALNDYVDYYYNDLYTPEELESLPKIKYWISAPYPTLAGTRSITFHDNSGIYESGYEKPTSYLEGTIISLPTSVNIARLGYTFTGWTLLECEWNEVTNPYVTSINITDIGNKTFYAKWTINRYTIVWKNGDTILETDENVEYGSLPTYDGQVPTKESNKGFDYTFNGWGPIIDTVSGDIIYMAQFSETPVEPAKSNLLWLWILLAVVGAAMVVSLLLWIFVYKRTVKFILNGEIVEIAKYKFNEEINIPFCLMGHPLFTDQEETKIFETQKMRWFGFTVYSKIEDTLNASEIDNTKK